MKNLRQQREESGQFDLSNKHMLMETIHHLFLDGRVSLTDYVDTITNVITKSEHSEVSATSQPLTLSGIIEAAKCVFMSDTINKVADLYGIQPESITNRGRKKNISEARAVCCYILRQQGYLVTEIASALHCTHAMVLYNLRRSNEWANNPIANVQAHITIHILTS